MTNSPEATSKDVLNLARSELLVNFRFLDRALLLLDFRESGDVSFLTDGLSLYYDPWFVAHRYSEDQNAVVRSYLHMILHMVFRHGFIGREVDERLWSMASDMAVENIINDMDRGFLRTRVSDGQEKALGLIRKTVGEDKPLTAEYIYKALEELTQGGESQAGVAGADSKSQAGYVFDDERMEELRLMFWGDSHALWYNAEGGRFSEDLDIQIRWEEISKRMQVELELMDKDKAHLLKSQLRSVNRAHQDYDEVLRKFALQSEILKVSDEEFDNNYYTYGLSLYGNMPIVEPLEYASGHRIRDFVIAIDTSGSIKSEIAEKFIAHTYTILSSENSFDEHARIHVIQADDRVRDDAVLRTKEDMKNYVENIEIYGRGETDFRPVFDYIDKLRREGELTELKGLIYFTDGEGTFPESTPDYDCCFVIHRDRMYEPIRVPSWAIRIELEDEDVLNGRFQS